jgi:hypothetical protein
MNFKMLGRMLTVEATPAWLALGLPAFLFFALGFFTCNPSKTWLFLGLSLQFIGILLVAHSIAETGRRFGKPSVVRQIKLWAQNVLAAITGKPRTLQLSATMASARLAGSGRMTVKRGLGQGTTEDRLLALERSFSDHDQALERLELELGTTRTKLSDAIAHEGRTRVKDVAALKDLVEDHAAGGLTLDVVALVWLLVGTVASTIPDALPAIQHLGCR